MCSDGGLAVLLSELVAVQVIQVERPAPCSCTCHCLKYAVMLHCCICVPLRHMHPSDAVLQAQVLNTPHLVTGFCKAAVGCCVPNG